MTSRRSSLCLFLATTAVIGCLAQAKFNTALASPAGPEWNSVSSERLVKLPPQYLKKYLDRDLSESELGAALKDSETKVSLKGNTLSELQQAITQADDGKLRLELRHQFLAEKREYLDLMGQQIDMRRDQAEAKIKLFGRMLDDLSNKKAADTPARRELVERQTLARDRMNSTLSQVDLKVFETANVPESRYAVKYGENVQAIEQLLSRIQNHAMNQSVSADGVEMTKEEFIRHMMTEAEAEIALTDQENAILGYMAKLVALDAMALSEEALDADLADSPLPGNAGPAKAVSFFMSN